MLKPAKCILIAAIIAMSSFSAHAADDQWNRRVALYGWGTHLNATASHPGLPSVTVDKSVSDVLDSIDFAAMGLFEARNDHYGILVDGIYVQMQEGASANVGPIELDANLKLNMATLMLAGQYRIQQTATSYTDLMLGVRGWSVKTDITVEPLRIKDKRSKQWADLMIGAKGNHDLSDDWFASWSAMIGGFDLSSNWVNDLHVGIGYRLNEHSAVQLGYRYMDVDYSEGNFDIDTQLGGLLLGIDYRF